MVFKLNIRRCYVCGYIEDMSKSNDIAQLNKCLDCNAIYDPTIFEDCPRCLELLKIETMNRAASVEISKRAERINELKLRLKKYEEYLAEPERGEDSKIRILENIEEIKNELKVIEL